MENYTVTILGCGVMGTAVLSSMLKSSFEPFPQKFICCTGSSRSAEKLKTAYGDRIEVSYGSQNVEAVRKADIIILGCKPYMCEHIMDSVADGLNGKQLIISLLAGWTIDQLKTFSPYIARVMTNTPAKYGCGMAIVSFSEEAMKYEDIVMKMVGTVGKAKKLPESNMDAATSLVGSGPAFCLVMMEALAEGGVRMGIPYDVAKECAAKVMEGTARMVMETGEHPEVLKASVCTPGGTTIGGLMVMEDKAVRSGISRAVEEAAKIASALGKK
ncbi:hypothetical protein FOA43_003376 [Brettanomyces nanus]|uniref:Pyrroline-5-carboxylate reductase n=1 Tax=Eeniella nana TaxID=13502 RepID=A0A875RQ65_EENNA|nr:uncharacterized protein FOA43_003376 [Brettanomyces nanus]QPG75990.1 hypothetical protein FOA43_003376 [Brettanomyces nanus]